LTKSGFSDAPERPLTRGSLLRGAAVLFGTLSATSVLASLAPSRAWALEVESLSQSEAETLLAFTQTLYPHATLPSAVYALAVRAVDRGAAADSAKKEQLQSGLAGLDSKSGGSFRDASHETRHAAATAFAGTPFFESVRSTCITALYDNELAYAHFGYEGPSFIKGGYKYRGFNDLTWLPNPPEDASPSVGVL
jgi:hypothetical protein